MIENLAFYLFSFILLSSAVLVVSSRNPVHSVLFLILAFINAAVLFLILISFTANSTHSLLGTAAAMDIGGRKMAGFASRWKIPELALATCNAS